MKRILGFLALCLLLAGCNTQNVPETTTAPVQTIQTPPLSATEPMGLYVPNEEMEAQTGGSLRCYRPMEDAYWMLPVEGDVLLFSGTDTTTLTRLAGDQLYVIARHELGTYVQPEDPSFQLSGYGITYYNPRSREVIFLDHDLKEVSRLGMPGDLVGQPVLSSNRRQAFYCTAEAVRVYDVETGLDRLIKTISYPEQTVSGILIEDRVLRCTLRDAQGMSHTLFLSTETGEELERIRSDVDLTTGTDGYCALIPDGIVNTIVYGTDQDDALVLTPRDWAAASWLLEGQRSVVTATLEENACVLDHYDLETGLRRASLKLPDGITPRYFAAAGSYLYLLGYDSRQNSPVLCRWEPGMSETGDETVYSGPRYTQENPDTGGLAACAAWAWELGQKHGIQIRIGTEALEQQPWDYEFSWEYQVPVIRSQLEKLEVLLGSFPEGFFDQIPQEKILCLVRSIQGSPQSGSVASAAGIQFWEGDQGYVVLAAGDTLESSFFHELFHIIDGKVLSDTRTYYYWRNLNPEGCKYFEDYTSYLTADVQMYLQDENRAFIDAYSLCYPREDRARIMEYACNPGNEQYFQSQIMQNKLRTLCEGIRDAFHLEDYPEPFLWEQYLQEPLTPKK